MTSSRIFAAFNALLAIHQTTFTDTTVMVYDGPQPDFPDQQDFIVVGCDDVLSSGMVQAVTNGDQQWLSMGANQPDKQESFSILCTYVTWSGDNDFPTLRSNASTNLALVEAAIRLDQGPTAPDGQLGTHAVPGPLGPTGWCNLSVRDMQTIQESSGTAMHVTYSIDCWTRI